MENSGFRVLNYDELIFIKRSLDVLVVSFILVVNLFCFILDFCFGDNVVGVGGGEGGVWVFGLSFMFFFIDVVFLFFLFILCFLGFGVLDWGIKNIILKILKVVFFIILDIVFILLLWYDKIIWFNFL